MEEVTSLSASDHSLMRKRMYLFASFLDMLFDLSSSIGNCKEVDGEGEMEGRKEAGITGIWGSWRRST